MPPADKSPTKPTSDREAKLAQALRANLRRRKASSGPAKPAPAPKNDDET